MNREQLAVAVYAKTEGYCWYCGKPLTEWQHEHVIPRSQNGKRNLANLVPSCVSCNKRKNFRNANEFKECIKERITRIEGTVDFLLTYFQNNVNPKDAKAIREAVSVLVRVVNNSEITWHGEKVQAERAA